MMNQSISQIDIEKSTASDTSSCKKVVLLKSENWNFSQILSKFHNTASYLLQLRVLGALVMWILEFWNAQHLWVLCYQPYIMDGT